MLFVETVMASKTDLRSYFKKVDSDYETLTSSQKTPRLFQSASNITDEAEVQYVEKEVKKQVEKSTVKYSNVISKIKEEIGSYALIHGTKSAIDRFSKVYTKYSLKRTTVNGWKESCKKKKTNHQPIAPIQRKGRPNLVGDEMMKKIKDIIVGSRLAGTAISRKMVIAIATGVVKASDPKLLREFGGSLELTEGWARSVLKSMDWVKRKGTTGKIEPCSKFLEEEKFTFQRAIGKVVSDHDIPIELVLNLDQTPLSYVSPGKYTFDLMSSKTVPIKGVNDKRQITAIFTVTASGEFLPIQLIYSGKTKRSLPKFEFPKAFDVTFTPNHWSNYEKCVSLFKKIIFPYLKSKKEELGYPKEQYSLIIMDTFKGQDNADIKELCLKNGCELVIVPHNLTNKFQPLDISINQKAKKFVSHQYNKWYADRVSEQLRRGVAPGDVKVSMKLSDLKPLHARWIVEMFDYLKQQNESIVNGFDKAGITEAVKSANEVISRIENPFIEKRQNNK